MSKQSGLGDNFYVAGVDLSGDTGSLQSIHGGMGATIEVTGIDKSAFERIGGLRDGGVDWTAYFNDATSHAHPTLSPLPTADVILTYCRGTTLGNAAAAMVAKQTNYDGTRADDGSLTFKVNAVANGYGLEWGRQLTAGKQTDTAAGNSTSVDHTTVSTAFGWQAYLHVFSFTGTSVTVKIQDSANDSVFADLSGAGFTTATGVTSERIAAASLTATVRRYLRVVTTGTFSSAVFAVAFVRNETATSF